MALMVAWYRPTEDCHGRIFSDTDHPAHGDTLQCGPLPGIDEAICLGPMRWDGRQCTWESITPFRGLRQPIGRKEITP